MDSVAGFGLLLRTLVALAAVCGAAYLILRYVLPRLKFELSQNGLIKVVEKAQIQPNQTLSIVQVCGRFYLIATTPNSSNLITELAAEEIEKSETTQKAKSETPQPAFQKFRDFLKREG